MLNKSRKGQAAMEYLMTYGWALLVIIIVLALFLWIILGIEPTRECSPTSAGFICSDPMPAMTVDTAGTIETYGSISNGHGKPIYVRGAFITDALGEKPTGGALTTLTGAPSATNSIRLAQGSSVSFEDFGSGTCTSCQKVIVVDSEGNEFTSGAITSGEIFQGTLWIAWNYVSDDEIGFNQPRWQEAKLVVDVSD